MNFASLKMSNISNDNYPESSIRVNNIEIVKNMSEIALKKINILDKENKPICRIIQI